MRFDLKARRKAVGCRSQHFDDAREEIIRRGSGLDSLLRAARNLTVLGVNADGAIIVGPVGWEQFQSLLYHRPGEPFEAEADGMGPSRLPRFGGKR